MKVAALAFSGKIASGKTTIATYVANSLGWCIASFGAYLRKQALIRGLDSSSREDLQALGNAFIAQGWYEFCSAVFRDAGWSANQGIVIDGIRHAEALGVIEAIVAPSPVCHVYVDISDTIRAERLYKRGIDLEAITRLEQHSTEEQVAVSLANRASLHLDGSQPVEIAAKPVLAWVKQLDR